MANEPILCPFGCGYKVEDGDDNQMMQLHVEMEHPDGDGPSPFAITEKSVIERLPPGGNEDGEWSNENWVYCPVESCGEALLLTELASHVEMHEEEHDGQKDGEEGSSRCGKRLRLDSEVEERGETFDTKLSYALRNLEDVDAIVNLKKEGGSANPPNGKGPKGKGDSRSAWRDILNMPASGPGGSSGKKRLGKSELGPHWNEKQMPPWLVKLLETSDGKMETENQLGKDGKMKKVKTCPNMASGVVPVISRLLDLDRSVSYAYLCDPPVRHVSKLKREGGFCGYRNIQMMCSYIVEAESQGHEVLNGKIPSIFNIQEHIETAWDCGINSNGRIETGGIRGTRKYIGTPDAQAMFLLLGIACAAESFKPTKDPISKKKAYDLLFIGIEKYFTGYCKEYDPKIRCTNAPPIYFQHPGHSMTIIGFEKGKDGSRNLLVFDPMFHDAPQVLSFVDQNPDKIRHRKPEDLLKAYRRGTSYLKKYGEFEILTLQTLKNVSNP